MSDQPTRTNEQLPAYIYTWISFLGVGDAKARDPRLLEAGPRGSRREAGSTQSPDGARVDSIRNFDDGDDMRTKHIRNDDDGRPESIRNRDDDRRPDSIRNKGEDEKRDKHIRNLPDDGDLSPLHIRNRVSIGVDVEATSQLVSGTFVPSGAGRFRIRQLVSGTSEAEAAAWIDSAEGKVFCEGAACMLMRTEVSLA